MTPTAVNYKEKIIKFVQVLWQSHQEEHEKQNTQGTFVTHQSLRYNFTRKLPSNSPIIRNTEGEQAQNNERKNPIFPARACSPRPIKAFPSTIDHHKIPPID